MNRSLTRIAAIYTTIFKNKTTQYITSDVPLALAKAGLAPKYIATVTGDLALGDITAVEKIPNITPAIIDAGVAALQGAYAHAFRITWLATIGFGGASVIVALFSRSIDDKLSHDVVRRLGHGFVSEKSKSREGVEEKGEGEGSPAAST